MMRWLQQISFRRNLRLFVMGIGLLLLAGCGENPTLQGGQENYSDCWPCAVYQATFTGLDKFLKTLINLSCDYAMTVLGIGLLFWLLFHVGKFVVTIQQPNIRKFVFPVTNIFFKAIVAAAIIGTTSGGDHVFVTFVGENFIQPILDFFVQISNLILDSNSLVKTSTQAASVASNINLQNTNVLFGDTAGRYLDIVYRIYVALRMGVSLGFTIWKQSGIAAWVIGFGVIMMFWMLLLTMPMSFIDALVRIAASLILAPFAIVGWVFPPTKQMLGRLWGILLGAGMTLMFSCFYIALTTYVVIQYAEKHYPGILGATLQAKDPKLVDAVQTMSTSLVGFFILVLCMNRLGGVVPKLANEFGGESVNSSFLAAFNGIKKLSIAAGTAAVALVTASPTVAKQALSEAKDVAKSVASAGAKKDG